MKKICACLAALCLILCSCASAEGVTMEGSVVSVRSEYVIAPVGGVVERVHVETGDRIEAGSAVASLKPQTVYAKQSGRVVFFGEPGDDTETVTALYGAVAVVEPDARLLVRASTRRAAEDAENRVIHPGETVYVQAVGGRKNTGTGMVTTVSAPEYSVRIQEGSFEVNESVNLYRAEDCSASSRIGQGVIALSDLDLYAGSGCIVSFLCENGTKVKKGDPLFETLAGPSDGMRAPEREVRSPYTGTVAALGVLEGDTLQKNYPAAEIWPDESMRFRASVSEYDLNQVHAGTAVQVEFEALYNESIAGVVEKVLSSPVSTDADEAMYTVIIRLDRTDGLVYGLHGTATLLAGEAEDKADALP